VIGQVDQASTQQPCLLPSEGYCFNYLWPVGFRSASSFGKDFLATSLLQRIDLKIEVLI
jgi:hypothetical protein